MERFLPRVFILLKNISFGEGGALLINDSKYIERAEIIREKGTNRSQFFRGEVNKYGWYDIGSSFLPSDLLAAILFGQLEKFKNPNKKKKNLGYIFLRTEGIRKNEWISFANHSKTLSTALSYVLFVSAFLKHSK